MSSKPEPSDPGSLSGELIVLNPTRALTRGPRGTLFVGPCKMDCDAACNVPAGLRMAVVPTPRHAWNDVKRCPNCGVCFLAQRTR